MIYKKLQLIYMDVDGSVKFEMFSNWKKLHTFLFDNIEIIDNDPDLAVYDVQEDDYKKSELLRLDIDERGRRRLKYAPDVPPSVLFEIINQRISAQL